MLPDDEAMRPSTAPVTEPGKREHHQRIGRQSGAARVPTPAPVSAELVAKLLHGISDPTRVRILELLIREGELHVSALVERLGQPQGRISAHLGCLRTCGWVTVRRVGKFAYYRVADQRVPLLLALAKDLAADHAAGILGCPLT